MSDLVAQGLPLFSHALAAVGWFKYPLLFVGAIFEGPLLTLASGFLLHTGALHFLPLYLSLYLGDLVGDVGWYAVGRFFARPVLQRHGRFLTLTPEMFEKIEKRFHKHGSLILFTSKVMMGFGIALATLTAAGAAKIPFRTFLTWNALGEIVYTAILLAIGYSLGNIYGAVATGFKTAFLVGSSAILIAALYFFAKYLRNKAVQ